MFEEETLDLPLHEVERGQMQKMQEVMRLMLQAHIDARGSGDVGKALEVLFFYHNRFHMRYDVYLKQGLPIASGSVEGACKNLVKGRMERSGMRWTEDMAEAMLKMRAIYLSGDFEDYWSFHIERDQGRLHPKGRWSPAQVVVQK